MKIPNMDTVNNSMITVAITVKAPIEKVWDCWTSPHHITQWCQASDDWHAPEAENDLTVGGKFKTKMAARNGSVSFDFGGTYTQVEPMKALGYALDDGRKATIRFEPEGDGVTVTESFEPEGQNPVEMQKAGWQAILDSFKKYTEGS